MSAPEKRHRAWPFFVVAVVLLGLALAGLGAPFNGLAAMGCAGMFIAACARIVRRADPEGRNPAHRAGMGGLGGGGF